VFERYNVTPGTDLHEAAAKANAFARQQQAAVERMGKNR